MFKSFQTVRYPDVRIHIRDTLDLLPKHHKISTQDMQRLLHHNDMLSILHFSNYRALAAGNGKQAICTVLRYNNESG